MAETRSVTKMIRARTLKRWLRIDRKYRSSLLIADASSNFAEAQSPRATDKEFRKNSQMVCSLYFVYTYISNVSVKMTNHLNLANSGQLLKLSTNLLYLHVTYIHTQVFVNDNADKYLKKSGNKIDKT